MVASDKTPVAPVAPVIVSPVAVARAATARYGKRYTDKQVRSLARSMLKRFDKTDHPERQAHAYSAREALTLLTGLGGRGGNGAAEALAVAATEAPLTDDERTALGLPPVAAS